MAYGYVVSAELTKTLTFILVKILTKLYQLF